MKKKLFLDIVKENYLALMKMLEQTIKLCTDELWSDNSINPQFWQEVFHTLYFLDYYFNEDWNKRPNRFEFSGNLDKIPATVISKEQLQAYLEEIKEKCINRLDNLSDADLEGESSHYWTGVTLSHHLIYNIRHSQHHVGKLNFILRSNGLEAAKWIIDSNKE